MAVYVDAPDDVKFAKQVYDLMMLRGKQKREGELKSGNAALRGASVLGVFVWLPFCSHAVFKCYIFTPAGV